MLHENHDEHMEVECKDPNINLVLKMYDKISTLVSAGEKVYHNGNEVGFGNSYSKIPLKNGINRLKLGKLSNTAKSGDNNVTEIPIKALSIKQHSVSEIRLPLLPEEQLAISQESFIEGVVDRSCRTEKIVIKGQIIYKLIMAVTKYNAQTGRMQTDETTFSVSKTGILRGAFGKAKLSISRSKPLQSSDGNIGYHTVVDNIDISSIEGQDAIKQITDSLQPSLLDIENIIKKREEEKEKNKQYKIVQKLKEQKIKELLEKNQCILDAEKLLEK